MSEVVEQAEAALRAFDEYWGDGGPVDPAYGRPFELIRALLAEVRAGVVAEEPEWEYRYAEIYDGGEMYTYGPKGDPDRSFATSDAADGARIDDTDIVVRRRKAGPWVPV